MVLAAGLGTRLLPITKDIPKPVVPIMNVPNLLHIFYLLKRAGIEDVILNLHHLPRKIENYLTNLPNLGLEVSYSFEEKLLGTGGGLKKAEPFFDGEPFVLANCDFVSNVDLLPFIDRHFERGASSTMLLVEDPKRQSRYSKVGVSKNGNMCALPSFQSDTPQRHGIFTGIHILDGQIFKHLIPEPSGVNELGYPGLMKTQPETVFADFLGDAFWYDTGDVPAVWESTQFLMRNFIEPSSFVQGLWKHWNFDFNTNTNSIWGKTTQLGKKVVIGKQVVIGDNVVIGDGAALENCIVLEGTTINPNEKLNRVIAYKDSRLTF